MNMTKLASLVFAAQLLSACSSQPSAPAAWQHWVCDSGAELQWRFSDARFEQVDVRLGGDDIVHRLSQEPAASGMLYSDGRLSFHSKGEQGLVYWTANDDLIGSNCRAP